MTALNGPQIDAFDVLRHPLCRAEDRAAQRRFCIDQPFFDRSKKLKDEKLKTQGKISKLKHKTKGFGKSGKNQGK